MKKKLTLFSLILFISLPSWSQISDGRYSVISRHSGLSMEVENASTEDGANVVQWEYWGGENQQFDVSNLGNGFYSIRPVHSGKSVDVFDWSVEPGGEIRQWEYWGSETQQFAINSTGDGYYTIISALSSLALEVWEWSEVNGGDIRQYTVTGGWNQHWAFNAVGSNPNPNPGTCGGGNATVTGGPGNYQVNGSGVGGDYFNAIMTAINSVGANQRVSVMADGGIGANSIVLPSNITFEVCGTMDVGNLGGRGAIEAIGRQNVSIPYLNMTGSPYFGMRFADIHGLHLGQINLWLGGGLGIRFERDLPGSTNVQMDNIYVSGTNNHGVETWNVDGLEIGTIVARNTAYAGLLLNNTRNANIGLVDGEGTATGTGYATLRFANENGRINGAYPTNIYVDRVISRGGGRGFFCVSNSGGAVINNIDLANNGNNSILIENCHNVTINGGTINGGGEVRIAARTEFPNTSDINFFNLNIFNTSVLESPCGDNVNWVNVNVSNGSYNVCN
ncbi:MAG: RICIN domain-containing protein [Spongiibacteraceae bacterium]|nr:RICIN domain-containing protein [Spongiibacteraceae bacterium]